MAAQNAKHQIARPLYDITHVQWKYPIMKLSCFIEEEISENARGTGGQIKLMLIILHPCSHRPYIATAFHIRSVNTAG